MIRKILKWTGITLASLLVVIIAAWLVAYFNVRGRQNKVYEVNLREIAIPTDSAAVAAGKRVFEMKGCGGCHGAKLEGHTELDDPLVGRFSGPNLTRGKGGVGNDRTDADWLRALRHGINKEGKSLFIMPSYEYYKMSDEDIASVIAFIKAQPAVDSDLPRDKLGPLGIVLSALDKVPFAPAEMIDHEYVSKPVVKKEVSAAYGEYLSMSCTGCHHPDFKGGESPIPGGKFVADISASGKPGKWSHSQFIAALRTGKTPEGKELNNAEMPWKMTATYTDDELTALHLYLQTIK
ncbi:cytochrome c [Chitinophaga sedimenti]|uniref:c-type cytochrome n=1 Tax=Chitinophaga sedimenti TaxID=2033606 RepID=UPI002005B9CA|nr:c-type cytochrome [Chitinophaga sedimenti]MCK7559228.1 cytochrome c [Chitinophaga sedimenti]